MNFFHRFLIFGIIAGIGITYIPNLIVINFFLELSLIKWIISLVQTVLFILTVGLIGAVVYPYLREEKPKKPDLNDRWFGRSEDSAKGDSTDINEFKVDVPQEVLEDLNRRIDSVRYIEPIAGTNFNYGFNVEYLKQVVHYWRTQFDWRKQESELNKYNQFTTQINGLKVHFIHVKPTKPVEKVVPLLVIHGWPGSVWEYYKSFDLLTEPTNGMAFEVICPSIPGYGFSEAPHQTGFDLRATASIFVKLMKRLKHDSFFIHGGDWGSAISKTMAKLYPEKIRGMHITMGTSIMSLRGKPLLKYIIGAYFPSLILDDPEKDYKKIYPFWQKFSFLMRESGYMHIQATKPDTVGTALNDSPVGLAAYILEKFSTWTDPNNVNKADGGLTEKFTLDELLTNVMIYWISNNVVSSLRYYKESMLTQNTKLPITVPSAVCDFPNELFRTTESTSRQECHNLVQFTEMPRGGHFGAFEEPLLLTDDIKQFVRTVIKTEYKKY